ncbi:WAP-type 'four-disulfide core [Oesophagostomum dentatum]|uniref:WAP-type 'four-disulfide core n=1 Tax=Oesophagostomum dentatum TaxID=61180 RepID=A0A0B1SVG3_OESDE|nr:WAP-type 'four-disulfide core [Oesophagostomum dentatum]
MKRCCRVGCSTQCLYPVRTTPCFHAALTAELYEMRNLRRCDHAGKFEPIQCDYNGCFCVDTESGEEIAGTRTTDDTPVCKTSKSCPEVMCRTSCPYDFEREPNGCQSCRCRNPCLEVKCPQGSFCIMTAVSCFQTESCPPQPRCVLNLCPRGEPFISSVGVVETCSARDQCPAEHWCHQVGFSSSGLCCPSPAALIHSGVCPAATPLLDRIGSCRFDCRADEDCLINEKCCYDGCGMQCKGQYSNHILQLLHSEVFMFSDLFSDTETSPLSSLGGNEDKKPEVIKPGACPYFDERQCSVQLRVNQCGSDEDCLGVQKCCSDGCAKKCLYPENNSACMQAKAALQMIGQSSKIQCRPDGSFEEIQCDADYCWCVNQYGVEVEGTRTSDDIAPNCLAPRKCAIPLCTHDISCKFGMKKDSNGCDTCECSSPCDGVICPDTSVCVPSPVECIEGPCSEYSDFNSTSKFFPEPVWSPGTCPHGILSNGDCFRHCVTDEECASGQKCCFNGCGMSCVAALFSAPPSLSIHIGECLPAKSLGAFCVQRSKESECSEDTDCLPLRKCCSDGCVRRCTFPEITTHCIHARLAALAIRDYDSSGFVPECDSNGDYQQIQSHYGLKWCVDKHGKEIPGSFFCCLLLCCTKTTRQPNCRLPRSCPVRVCDKQCPFGQRSDNEGCSVCDCVMPCELVQCQAGFICRMVQPRCYTKSCAPIPRCKETIVIFYFYLVSFACLLIGIPNTCPSGEPLISEGTWMLAECDEHNACPTGHFCSQSGYEGRGFCCSGTGEFFTAKIFFELFFFNKILFLSAPPLPPISCPSLPITANPVDSSTCVVACRRAVDCAHSVCCFNGCGTSCQFETGKLLTITGSPMDASSLPGVDKTRFVSVNNRPHIQTIYKKIAPSSVDQHPVEASISSKPQITVVNAVEPEKKHPIMPDLSTSPNAGITGAGVASISGVLEENSVPISAVQKVGACPSVLLNPGCREECIADADCAHFSKCCKASCGTKCVEPSVTSSCLHRLAAFSKEWPHLPPPIQCLPDGEFREVQCDFKRRYFKENIQCWCVDTSGNEVIGTRTASLSGSPHCKTPKICSTSCNQSSCTYGVQLDANGCPRDGVCLCRNPCDDFVCSPHKTCTLAPVKCVRDACPPIPRCVAAPCSDEQLAKDLYGNAFSCRADGCPKGTCVSAVGEDIGVCCLLPPSSKTTEVSKSRSSCAVYRLGIEELRKRGVQDVYQPTCDPTTGRDKGAGV